MDYQALVLEAAKADLPDDFAKQLRPLLASDSPLLAVLGQIQRRAQEIAWSLQAQDLVSDGGRAEALKKQGQMNGLIQAIEIVTDPLKEEDSDTV